MSLLTELNNHVSQSLPAWSWDWLQIWIGCQTILLVMLQRAYSPRFQTARITCIGDRMTIRAGQIGLSGLGVLGFLLALDGALPDRAPPRTLIVLGSLSYNLIQIRVVHEVFLKWLRTKRLQGA